MKFLSMEQHYQNWHHMRTDQIKKCTNARLLISYRMAIMGFTAGLADANRSKLAIDELRSYCARMELELHSRLGVTPATIDELSLELEDPQ